MERDWPPVIAGSALVVAGSSVAGIYSFRGDVPVVFAGFCLFVAGYFLARDGWSVLDPTRYATVDVEPRLSTGHPLVRGGLGLVGVLGIAAGVTKFSLTVVDPTLGGAVRAGVYSVGGYAWTHVIIHGKLF